MTWSVAPLRELADVVRGVTYKKEQARDCPTTGHVPLLRATNIGDSLDLTSGLIYVPESVVGASQRLQSGDIVLASSSGSLSVVGKSAPLRGAWDGTFGAFCAVIRSSPRVDARFLALYLRSHAVRSRWSEAARGTNINNLKRGDLEETPVPLPPITEQLRIVELLEDHLSRLDAADAQIKLGLRRIDAMRIACMRRTLTAQPNWTVAPIADWLQSSIGGLWGNEPGVDEIDVRVVRVTELKAWGRISPVTAAIRSITGRQLSGRLLSDGDLLLEKSGGGPKTPVGRVGLVEAPSEASICANFMQLMRPDRSRVNPRFLHYALNAFHLSGGTATMQTASTNIRNIKASEYLQTPIAVPSLDKQDSLAEQIAAELEAAHRLETAAETARVRSAALRRSLLAAAFTGYLTGSDTDLSAAEEMIGT